MAVASIFRLFEGLREWQARAAFERDARALFGGPRGRRVMAGLFQLNGVFAGAEARPVDARAAFIAQGRREAVLELFKAAGGDVGALGRAVAADNLNEAFDDDRKHRNPEHAPDPGHADGERDAEPAPLRYADLDDGQFNDPRRGAVQLGGPDGYDELDDPGED